MLPFYRVVGETEYRWQTSLKSISVSFATYLQSLDVQRTHGKVDSSGLGVRFEINAVIILKATMIGIVLPLFMAIRDQMVRTEGTRSSRVMEVLTM